jgi:hypothetical protein
VSAAERKQKERTSLSHKKLLWETQCNYNCVPFHTLSAIPFRLDGGSQEAPPQQQQQVPTGAPSAEAASAGDDERYQVAAAVSAEPQQSSQQLALESRDSSAESLFTDPLTSPVAAAATLAPLSPQQQGDSVASSYHSDAGEAMVVAAPQTAPTPPAVATPEASSPGTDLLSEILNYSGDLMTKSFVSVGNVAEEAAGVPMRTASGGAFTLIRHKKVELTPLSTEATADLVGADSGEFCTLYYNIQHFCFKNIRTYN